MNFIGIFTTVISKNLSTNDYGTYGLILSIIISLKTFSSLGLSSVITRNIAVTTFNQQKIIVIVLFLVFLFHYCFLYHLFCDDI